jgi:Peptidase family M28
MGGFMSWTARGAATLFGGVASDSTTWPTAEQGAGKLLVMLPPPEGGWISLTRAMVALRRNPRFSAAAGFALVALDQAPPGLVARMTAGRVTSDTLVFSLARGSLLVTPSAASALLGVPLASVSPGHVGPAVTGAVAFRRFPVEVAPRNVIAVLRGSDSALRGTYVSLSAHNDHIGFARPPVDHDSTRAFNRVVRPMGEDSPSRPATPEEAARVASLRDSLRAAHPAKRDSVYNGADDDGSGTVALVELARVLASGARPRRSILFVSHTAEERGLLGSRWFTDHPTVPLDSIVAELDMDMIGRGDASDLPHGAPGYLELVGSRRLSTEFGNLIETVAGQAPQPFHFNYEYDAPGHPLQYYCRADHFSYARYGIPSVSLSTGEHLDYHQVTDEAQYIDYAQLARVTSLVRDVALAVANLDHRPVVDGRRQDPRAPCSQ